MSARISRVEALHGAKWSAVESFGGQALSFLVFLLLARLLSARDFGVIAIANIFVLVAQYLIFQGLGQAILQFEDLDDLHLDTIFWINLVIGIALVLLTIAGAPLVESAVRTPGLGAILRGLSPVLLFAALTDAPNNLLSRTMRFRTLAWRTIFSYSAGAVAAVVLACRGAGAWSLVAQQLVIWSANLVILTASTPWRPRFRFCMGRARRLLGFGAHLLWSDLVGLVNRRSDQLFVGRFFGPLTGGLYSVGSRVAMLVSEVLIRSFGRVTVAALSRLQDAGARFNTAVYEAAEMQGALILPVAVGLAIVAPDVVALFLGTKWAGAVPIMQALLLACPFEALSTVHQSALVARGRPHWCSIITTAHAVANVALFAVAIRWGARGIAVAFACRAGLLYFVELSLLRRVAGLSAKRFLKPLAAQAAAALAMAGMILLVREQFKNGTALALLAASLVTGAATYIGLVALFNPRLVKLIKVARLPILRSPHTVPQ